MWYWNWQGTKRKRIVEIMNHKTKWKIKLVCIDLSMNNLNLYTSMNAWPFEMFSLCIAGNWWLPVVSVICKVHMFLLHEITCRYVSSIVGMYESRNVPGADAIRVQWKQRVLQKKNKWKKINKPMRHFKIVGFLIWVKISCTKRATEKKCIHN